MVFVFFAMVLIQSNSFALGDCTESFQCTGSDTITCSNSNGDCELVDCKYLRCGIVKIPLDGCPTCPVTIE